jgi:hypothetical protein
LVIETKLKRLRIDVVSELHEIRSEYAKASSEEIKRVVVEVLKEMRKKKN